jgi:hypothetical protein
MVVEAPRIEPPVSPVLTVAEPPAAAPAHGPINGANFEGRLQQLGLTQEQMAGVLALSREVVERAVWEVVPVMAEALIKEEIQRLTRD